MCGTAERRIRRIEVDEIPGASIDERVLEPPDRQAEPGPPKRLCQPPQVLGIADANRAIASAGTLKTPRELTRNSPL